MPKGDHILVSDELADWIADNADDPERVGRMMVAAVRHWTSGGQDAGDIPDDLAEVAGVFLGQLDRFRGAVAAQGGMTAEERREYNRRRQANLRARKAGRPEPFPGLLPVASVANATRATRATNATRATSATSATPCDTRDNPTQGNASQITCASAPAREGGERFAPLSREEARAVGAAAGLPAAEVDAWWDYYESLDWAPSAKAGPNARMSRDAAIASLRKWQRNRAVFGDSGRPRRGAAARPASAIRDLAETTDAEKAESEMKYGF